MVANRIWILIGKKVSGEATPQELEELRNLVAESGDSVNSIGEFEQMLLTVNIEPAHKSDDEINERWERFKAKLEPESRIVPIKQSNSKKTFVWLVAASVLMVCSITLALIARSKVAYRSGLLTKIDAPTMGPIKKVLPDGSVVWLNASSKLIYGKDFGVERREVTLVGEAFFDVVKDRKRPFIVSTASLRLKVLGTSFNVRAFANEKKSEAALVKGSLEVTLVNNPDKTIILKPSEKITVRNSEQEVVSAPAAGAVERGRTMPIPLMTLSNIHYKDQEPVPVEAQWIEKKLAFESENFEDIALRMERYYGVSINFKDEAIKSLVFSGTFKEEPFIEAIKNLQTTSSEPFKFKVEQGNQITIYK